jgi:hypothetical protein
MTEEKHNLYSSESMALFEKACIDKNYDLNEHIVMIFENDDLKQAHCMSKVDLVLKLINTEYFSVENPRPILQLGNMLINVSGRQLTNMLSLDTVTIGGKQYYYTLYKLLQPIETLIVRINVEQGIEKYSRQLVYDLDSIKQSKFINNRQIEKKIIKNFHLGTEEDFEQYTYIGEVVGKKPLGYGKYIADKRTICSGKTLENGTVIGICEGFDVCYSVGFFGGKYLMSEQETKTIFVCDDTLYAHIQRGNSQSPVIQIDQSSIFIGSLYKNPDMGLYDHPLWDSTVENKARKFDLKTCF